MSTAVAVADEAGGTTPAVAVAALGIAAICIVYLRRSRPARTLASAPAHRGPRDERRALLLVDKPPSDSALASLRLRANRVLVVSPARTTRLRHWVSDLDDAREKARRRMDVTVTRMRSAHIQTDAVIGDDDPIRALDDALRSFGGDEIVAATDDDQLVARVRERYALPITRA
ncbi:MAG TPA: hypothetical protein VE261_07970 [Gaiellaceae bacterium]|nr:hypothetical protein [Gaiellaceae bacterium]